MLRRLRGNLRLFNNLIVEPIRLWGIKGLFCNPYLYFGLGFIVFASILPLIAFRIFADFEKYTYIEYFLGISMLILAAIGRIVNAQNKKQYRKRSKSKN